MILAGRLLQGSTRPTYSGVTDAGWSSSVARWAHNPEVAGSNPAPATTKPQVKAMINDHGLAAFLGRASASPRARLRWRRLRWRNLRGGALSVDLLIELE